MLGPNRLSAYAAVLLLLQLAGQVQAGVVGTVSGKTDCGLAIWAIYRKFKFPGKGAGGGSYSMICQNPTAIVSTYASMYTYCQDDEIESAVDVFQHRCQIYGDVDYHPEYAANLTREDAAKIRVLKKTEIKAGSNVTEPFVMSADWYDITYRTLAAWDGTWRAHVRYTFACYGFWCIVLCFGLAQNIVYKVLERRRGYTYADAEGSSSSRSRAPNAVEKLAAVTRKYITTPSSLPPYHQQRIMGCTIPTRAESFVVLSYWIITIVLSAVTIHGFQGNTYWTKPSSQIWRYMADRTGIMSYGNLPLLWIFSGRNNILIWLTGWSFGTFNIFHRHVARIATLQAILHSIGYTGFYFCTYDAETYREEYAEFWWTAGIVATVVMSFTILFSFSIFRNKLYENFLLVHIIFSALLIVFLYYHTAIFDLEEFNYPFLLTVVAIWGFDRLLRIVRQLYCNLHVSRNRGKTLQTTKATVTYHEAGNMLTISLSPGNANLVTGPGQHYFLYQPLRFLGWENHPFTLAHWAKTSGAGGSGGDSLQLQFWVRPYDGWTKKLKRDCLKKGGATATISTAMLLEGPYGHSEPVHTFEEVLLVAGGSGIAGVLPYLLDYVRRADQGAAAGSGGRIPTRTRHLTLVWADRSAEYIRQVADGVLAGMLGRPDISFVFYHTAGAVGAAAANPSTASSSTDDVHTPRLAEKTAEAVDGDKGGVLSGSGSADGGSEKAAAAAGRYTIRPGRPDVLSTVRKTAQSVHGTSARLAVMVCGPNELADNVRHVVAQNMETGRESIQYFEESFGW